MTEPERSPRDRPRESAPKPVRDAPPVMRIGELLILAGLWMLFGFMVWYYASAWHGAPARLLSERLLATTLGDALLGIVPNPDQAYVFLVQTRIPFTFPDGSREALGFLVNPLVYGYGLPLLFGLTMATELRLWSKLLVLLAGYVVILAVQTWGVYWESLKTLLYDFGPEARAVVLEVGVPENLVALCYQLGVLILPPLAPVIVWIIGNRAELQRFIEQGPD